VAPIIATTEVNRPVEEVFAYATDPARFAEWQKGVVDGHLEGLATVGVGARCVTTRRIGLANRPTAAEVTHVDPPKTWGVRGVDGPIRATVDLTAEPLGESRSRLTIAIEFEGHGIGKVLVPLLVRRAARKEMPANMAALRQRLEGTV
jgi:uncharacterized protein YndB with AHSA1/START domain